MNTIKTEWLINRLKKNTKKLTPLIKRWNTTAYRIYDKDIPEIPYQIDRLADQFWITEKGVHNSKIEQQLKLENIDAIKFALMQLYQCHDTHCWWQTREDSGVTLIDQEKFKEITVDEGQAKFILRLGAYRDTGLFLDHRPLRLKLSQLTGSSRQVLNLFCYTSSFSIHLAQNGHITTNIDLSKTYLDWSKSNFELNQINLQGHRFLQADILKWLDQNNEAKHCFDLIILDPPSFSNSKRMGNDVLDIQRDHRILIQKCLELLNKESGVLYFSTNLRSFKLDLENFSVPIHLEDITTMSIPEDFRDSKIHQCFKITYLQKKP